MGKWKRLTPAPRAKELCPSGKGLCSLCSGGRQPPLAAEGGGIAIGHASGVRVQRVHKVQRVQRVWYRRFAAMRFIAACRRQRCLGQRKPNNRACGAMEMHPPLPTAPLHGKSSHVIFRSLCSLTNHVRLPPRRGRFTLRSAFGLISILRHSTAKTSPSGGSGAQHQKGCISSGEARLYGFLSVTVINSN